MRKKKMLWHTKVTLIAILIVAIVTVPKSLEDWLEEVEIKVSRETIDMITLLRLTKIFLQTCWDFLLLRRH